MTTKKTRKELRAERRQARAEGLAAARRRKSHSSTMRHYLSNSDAHHELSHGASDEDEPETPSHEVCVCAACGLQVLTPPFSSPNLQNAEAADAEKQMINALLHTDLDLDVGVLFVRVHQGESLLCKDRDGVLLCVQKAAAAEEEEEEEE